MKKLPTAEEFAKNNHTIKTYPLDWHVMIEFAKLHVQAALESAYNNIEYTTAHSSVPYVVEESILNAYPLDRIK